MALSDQNFESELIDQLQRRYGESISRLDVQASLMRIQAFVMERYPDDGLARFRRIILGAFPQYAESIFSVLERLARYNEWLIENHSQLADLGHLERNGMLWAKRHELSVRMPNSFGLMSGRSWHAKERIAGCDEIA